MRRIELIIETIIFQTRWILAPFYLGLAFCMLLLLYHFGVQIFEFVVKIPARERNRRDPRNPDADRRRIHRKPGLDRGALGLRELRIADRGRRPRSAGLDDQGRLRRPQAQADDLDRGHLGDPAAAGIHEYRAVRQHQACVAGRDRMSCSCSRCWSWRSPIASRRTARSRSTPVPGKHHKDAPGRHFIAEGFSVAPLAVVIAWRRRWPPARRHPYRRALIDDRMSLERAPAEQPFAIRIATERAMMPASHEGERDACGSFTSASADMRRLSGTARTGGRRRQISQPSRALGGRLCGRRTERHRRAGVRRVAVGPPWPAVRHRESRRHRAA